MASLTTLNYKIYALTRIRDTRNVTNGNSYAIKSRFRQWSEFVAKYQIKHSASELKLLPNVSPTCTYDAHLHRATNVTNRPGA